MSDFWAMRDIGRKTEQEVEDFEISSLSVSFKGREIPFMTLEATDAGKEQAPLFEERI